MDDCLKSLPKEGETSQLASDLQALLLRGGFKLTKWISNSRRVLETIPEDERAKEGKTLDLIKDGLPVERALGVKWCVESDTFSFNVDIKLKPPTRRGILLVVSSVYDPLELAAPFVSGPLSTQVGLRRSNFPGGQHSLEAMVSRSSQVVTVFNQALYQTNRL